jgi:hypothetical protein
VFDGRERRVEGGGEESFREGWSHHRRTLVAAVLASLDHRRSDVPTENLPRLHYR